MTGYAGFSGSRKIYQNEETRKKLLDHYPKSFFTVLGEISPEPFPEPVPGIKDRESALDGGVFGALWRLMKRNCLGAEFSQRAIPVKQQTVEICESFDLDPYRMESEGCILWLAEDPEPLRKKAAAAGVCCVQIGFAHKGSAICRTDGASVAYLRRPES